MIRVTIETKHIKSAIEDIEHDDGDLDLMLQLFEQALQGAGFVFDGHLDFLNEEDN